MIELKVKTVAWGFVVVVIIIALFHEQMGALADMLINGPDIDMPDNIPIPGGQ